MSIDSKAAVLGNVEMVWNGKILTVVNAEFKRQWELTDCGLMTTLLKNTGKKWVETVFAANACDWHLFSVVTEKTKAELRDLKIEAFQNPVRISPHVAATFEFFYPDNELIIRYMVQAFPSAVGVRTQLSVCTVRPRDKSEMPSYLLESYAELLRMPASQYTRRAIGYYSDLQHRNHDDTPIFKEEMRSGDLECTICEVYDWANILSMEDENSGLVLVKESHKCVNQQGVDTGSFVLHEDDLRVTGLGLKANTYEGDQWLSHDKFRKTWATWCVPYTGGESDRQLAVKKFDRARFMPNTDNVLYSRANTWGTRARVAVTQNNILENIVSCADLGIDALAIDDGWQCPMEGLPSDVKNDNWLPDPGRFPNGWSNVRQEAAKAGVEMELWHPGRPNLLVDGMNNIDMGGFTGFKVDFLDLRTHDQIEKLIAQVERLVEYAGRNRRISWDVTETAGRLGYFFGREFGSLHISNRHPTSDGMAGYHVAYCPRLTLRDVWQLAHYVNLNHIEVPIQDVDKISPDVNNASEYSHAYCLAIALMALPLFFQEPKFLSEEACNQIRLILHTWREHRNEIARGYTFPIGNQPSDKSWTGFQNYNPQTGEGYVLLFRELYADESKMTLPLHFVENRQLKWQDILSGEIWSDSKLTCSIETSPGFRWLKYSPEIS